MKFELLGLHLIMIVDNILVDFLSVFLIVDFAIGHYHEIL